MIALTNAILSLFGFPECINWGSALRSGLYRVYSEGSRSYGVGFGRKAVPLAADEGGSATFLI